MKRFDAHIIYISLATLLLLPACKQTDASEAETDDAASEQMMDATFAGRNVAREFVNRTWTDTVELQHHLLDAKARQSEYLRSGHPEKAAEFDSAFVSTIYTVNPSLAHDIFAPED